MATKKTTRKNANFDIFIDNDAMLRLKLRAAEEGISCEDLAASIIHKFVAETPNRRNSS